MAVQLQEAKSQIQITSSANATMQWKILQQEWHIKQQKATIQNLKAIVDSISQENDLLRCTKGTISSHRHRHKQTCTTRPGEDVVSEGIILYVVHQQDRLLLGQLHPTFPSVWME